MASQTLETIIAINAQTNGFAQVGATLTELGTLVNKTSRQLIDFGKESIDVYQDYEKSMAEAKVALSTSYGQGTKELEAAMDQLNAAATQWAATTIFHTDDVAHAINQAAHAGWDLDMIMHGLPVAMQLAQAGSMDLSESLEYITKTMKAFDVPYEDLSEFVDMWVYAANSSTGDVKDFGDAMRKMGATMRFTDSKEELFALIGLMHDMGESGSTAATLLRTSMMRILAPSGVASKVMEQLGATDEEINEIREDASKLAALDLLESYGFNAFKDNGQAKPIIEIYAELGSVLAEIAGGYENITKNQTTLGVLGTIFGMRGITGALDIVTALQNAVVLRDQLMQGNAEGYGEYAAETMMDTLYGSTEIFESKVERLKQVIGEELSSEVKSVQSYIGGIVDKIAEMDEGKLSALVSGLEVIALTGPGLLLAGGAFRLIGTLLTPAGGIALGLAAITAAATAMTELQKADFEDTFGDMNMDTESIKNYITGLGQDFKDAYTYVNQFQEALGLSVTNYREASSTFSTNLFSLMIQNTKLTEGDLSGLLKLGEDMYNYVQEAIYTAASGSAEYWTALFGGDEEALENESYRKIIELTNQAYEENESQLREVGTKMRNAITDAFTNDNQISEEEYNEILGYMREYNAMVARAAAQAQDEESFIKMNRWLNQAQTGSYTDVNELSRTAQAERDQILQQYQENFENEYYRLMYYGADESVLAETRAKYDQQRMQVATKWDEFMLSLWDSQLTNNEQADNYNWLKAAAGLYMHGDISPDEAIKAVTDTLGKSSYSGNGNIFDNGSARAQLAKITGYMLTALGGEAGIQEKIGYYAEQGNTEMAYRLQQLYAMEQLANGFYAVQRTEPIDVAGFDLKLFGDYETNSGAGGVASNANRRAFEEQYVRGRSPEYLAAKADADAARAELAGLEAEQARYAREISKYEAYLNGEYRGFETMFWSDASVRGTLYGSNGNNGIIATKEQLDAQVEAAKAKLKELDENAKLILDLDTTLVDQYVPPVYKTYVEIYEQGVHGRRFAEGGRATQASVFGEAGPEWAIPEEHSSRTAELLNAARAASGFTWLELLDRFGGLNANPQNQPTTIVYSPTINASDATGVERVLQDDKRRFEKWFEEKNMRDAVEVYT